MGATMMVPKALARGDRQSRRGWAYRLGWMRLWQHNSRRTIGRWFLPVFLLLAWYANRNPNFWETVTWVHVSAGIGVSTVLIAPVATGMATWIAEYNHRYGPEELLAVVPRARFWHDLAAMGGLAFWAWLAYLIQGLVQGLIAGRLATWGGPDFAPIWIGFLVIGVAIGGGYALGHLLPSLLRG